MRLGLRVGLVLTLSLVVGLEEARRRRRLRLAAWLRWPRLRSVPVSQTVETTVALALRFERVVLNEASGDGQHVHPPAHGRNHIRCGLPLAHGEEQWWLLGTGRREHALLVRFNFRD